MLVLVLVLVLRPRSRISEKILEQLYRSLFNPCFSVESIRFDSRTRTKDEGYANIGLQKKRRRHTLRGRIQNGVRAVIDAS